MSRDPSIAYVPSEFKVRQTFAFVTIQDRTIYRCGYKKGITPKLDHSTLLYAEEHEEGYVYDRLVHLSDEGDVYLMFLTDYFPRLLLFEHKS